MRLFHVAIVSSAFIIAFGILIVIPNFVRPYSDQKLTVMLSVSVVDPENVSAWTADLAVFFRETGIGASIFFVGKIAEAFPNSVREFSDNVDIGSETYGYVDLASLNGTDQQLEEIDRGKFAVEYAGNLRSRLFRVSLGSTDGSIFSLLGISGVVADFSYGDHYNVRVNDQWIRYECSSFNGSEDSQVFFTALSATKRLRILNFNNTVPVSDIIKIVFQLRGRQDVEFVNASQVSGFNLTER